MFNWFTKDTSGSVFTKLTDNHELVAVAKGRIIAADAAHRELASMHSDLLSESSRVHEQADQFKEKLEALLTTL